MLGDWEQMQEGNPWAETNSRKSSWTDSDVVRCAGCYYWRLLPFCGMACHYPIDEQKLRPCKPKDCYMHEGTPYRTPAGFWEEFWKRYGKPTRTEQV